MAELKLGVVLHGITGRMGDVAHRALKEIVEQGGIRVGADTILPVAIGVGRDESRLEAYARESGLAEYCVDLAGALDRARSLNPDYQIYHNAVTTGARHRTLLAALPLLDPATTGIFCEKPIAANYKQGWDIVEALERGRFVHGVVHDMLQAPGIAKALHLVPKIKPISCQMVFGYEVGDGTSGNADFRGQRPDFNWQLAEAGGGIILDMCHEAYVSNALFGTTERLSAVARLLIDKRVSATTDEIVHCDVEDYASIRREHTSGVVNNSAWTWLRRINSEFGPLEITVEGREGTLVFGLHGLKVQWKESAPAVRWRDSLAGEQIAWRDHWEYLELEKRNPFAIELDRFVRCLLLREAYPYDAARALDWLGEVEAIYESAAHNGQPIGHDKFLHYPDKVAPDWQPERLQGLLGKENTR